jgi:hypothetical protein
MDHELTPDEDRLLASLLERFDFDPVIVRLSDTMLSKSIIDARGPVRAMLSRTGLIDFGAIGQGPDQKVTIELPLIVHGVLDRRQASFYRPSTKRGDPRFWIARLAAEAKGGDALVLAFADGRLVAFLLTGSLGGLERGLAGCLPGRFEERARLEARVAKLVRELAPLANVWIPSGRSGPTGVGYTLESYLGIAANSSRAPDLGFAELKAYRRGAQSGSGKLVSLFAKTPNWMGLGKGPDLLSRYGYYDPDRDRQALYCTITTAPNTLGWSLELEYEARQVFVVHEGDRVLRYDLEVLEHCLEMKHPATLFVVADVRRAGATEEFRYGDVVLCREPSLARFIELMEEGLLGLDFTLHFKPDGTARDHGYLWRIRESAISRLYAYRKRILPA